jgi:hypothetical protein
LLANCKPKGEPFVFQIVTADETWIHILKWRQKAVHGMSSAGILWEEKSQSWSTFKVMLTVLWYWGEVILVEMMPGRETVNSDTYVRTLTDSGSFSNIFNFKNPT